MKIFAALAALALSASVAAQTASPQWELRERGAAQLLGTYPTQTACDAAARLRNAPGVVVYECPRFLRVTGSVQTCRAPTPTVNETRACPAGFTGTQTRSTVYTMGPYPSCVESSVTSAWAGVCTPVVVTPPPAGTVLHFSDCAPGAAVDCVAGSNSNPGTQAAPKQNLNGVNVNSLPAGSSLRFARGGAWDLPMVTLENLNVSAAAPLVFEPYGTGPAPWLRAASAHLFDVGGNWGNTTNDGGYIIRNLKLDGAGIATWGFWFAYNVRDVIIEGNEVTGFAIAFNSNDGTPHGVRGITLRNNNVHHNSDMGLLGHYDDLLMEGNTFEANNFSGSGFSHGSYIGGGNNITIRNNSYLRNSVANGVCQGGNMTFHGQIDGMLIEGNVIEQDAAAPGCWLMSITRGYTTPEWFRNTIVRGNWFVNGGNNALAVQSAPGIVVEGNVAVNTRPTAQTAFAVGVGPDSPTSGGDAGDVGDTGAIVRNNTACQSNGASGPVVSVNSPGGVVTGNTVRTGPDASSGICVR